MSQIFNKEGSAVPVTLVAAGPCFITQIKDKRDDFQSIQIGFEKLKDKKVKKSQNKKPYRWLREFRITKDKGKTSSKMSEIKIGDKISVDIFKEGDVVKISSTSKGKGFQGVVKRHGFSGGPATHGHRHVLRRGGSIGSSFPERVIKGKKMPGQTGGKRITVKNLKVIMIDTDKNLMAVKGAIPGPNNGFLEIKTN